VEIGAFFILLIVFVVLAVGGGLLYGVAARLRRAKLDPREDRLESAPDATDDARPEHLRVANEQRSELLPRA
jgi:hypothetical protein